MKKPFILCTAIMLVLLPVASIISWQRHAVAAVLTPPTSLNPTLLQPPPQPILPPLYIWLIIVLPIIIGAAIVTLVVILFPGVVSNYKNGWRQLWKHFLVLLLIGIIFVLISSVSPVFNVVQGTGGAGAVVLGIFSLAYGILLTNPIGYGVSFAYLKAARDDPLNVKDMFEVFHNYWNAVLASLLVGVIIAIGFVLLIVPGIIFACKLAFTPYLVVDRRMEVIEAVKASWRMTGGYAWKVFLIGLLAIPISIAGLLCFGVGIIVAIMWVSLAFASLYHAVSSSVEASVQ